MKIAMTEFNIYYLIYIHRYTLCVCLSPSTDHLSRRTPLSVSVIELSWARCPNKYTISSQLDIN